MNILFLPMNIASMQAITASELNKIPGVNAKVLTLSQHKYIDDSSDVVYLNKYPSRRKPIEYIKSKIFFKRKLKSLLKWADILHYVWSPVYQDGRELEWPEFQNKPVFVEWVGSDIRDPEILKKINPYYKEVFDKGYEYKLGESSNHKYRVQKMFSKAGAIPTICAEMSLFIKPEFFSTHILLQQRINLKDFKPAFPSQSNNKPLIIHSPSAKHAKGSFIIEKIINELRQDYNFDFQLLHNMSRQEVLSIMSNADIFLDQIIGGSYGMASMEAMSFGKPVMCYIMPEVYEKGLPAECPIISTNPDNLKENLIQLITSPELRNKLGKESRAFVENYHDVEKVSLDLLQIYKDAI